MRRPPLLIGWLERQAHLLLGEVHGLAESALVFTTNDGVVRLQTVIAVLPERCTSASAAYVICYPPLRSPEKVRP